MELIKKIKTNLWVLRSLLPTLYFNFKCLPLKQAIKLPIFLYRPRIVSCSGKITILGGVKTGMIKLGHSTPSIYPNGGISIDNRGTIEFRGRCDIGSNSYISTGKTGKVSFGANFIATNSLKIACYRNIDFGDNTLCGWECMFIDTDFHKLSSDDNSVSPRAFGNIKIGNECWFGFKCIILKNTSVPNACVIASNSLLNKKYEIPIHSLLAGSPAVVKRNGIYRNPIDDVINYSV